MHSDSVFCRLCFEVNGKQDEDGKEDRDGEGDKGSRRQEDGIRRQLKDFIFIEE